MRALRAIVLLLTMLVLAAGCASTPGLRESPGYYGRGTIHSDSFPPNYVPGGGSGWGRYGRY